MVLRIQSLGFRLRVLELCSVADRGKWNVRAVTKSQFSVLIDSNKRQTTLRHIQAATGIPSFRHDGHGCSYHHRACGYIAGLHSYKPHPGTGEEDPEFSSFETAWKAIQSVPEALLNDFEDELWETQSRRFVYGTKTVSVIDAVESSSSSMPFDRLQDNANGTNASTKCLDKQRVFRYLVINERPNLIQTAVEVPFVGAPYRHYYDPSATNEIAGIFDGTSAAATNAQNLVPRPPSPISQTHLGGLAMVLPFWRRANSGTAFEDTYWKEADRLGEEAVDGWNDSPNCVLIGAGGCSLAHTMAADLRSRSPSPPNAGQRPLLTAVEACPEIVRVSELYFGAGDEQGGGCEASSFKGSLAGPPSPPFDLVCDTGQSYLKSLVGSTKEEDPRPLIDVLVIDAEDGSAPPESMRTPKFWSEAVLPALGVATLSPSHGGGPVVGVNAIGTDAETTRLVDTMRAALACPGSGSHYCVIAVSPPPEAGVSDRHKLVFALPCTNRAEAPTHGPHHDLFRLLPTEDELRGCVDVPTAWAQQVRIAFEECAGI